MSVAVEFQCAFAAPVLGPISSTVDHWGQVALAVVLVADGFAGVPFADGDCGAKHGAGGGSGGGSGGGGGGGGWGLWCCAGFVMWARTISVDGDKGYLGCGCGGSANGVVTEVVGS